jgi:N-methylhydantoinase A
VREFSLVAFGGSGPVHAAALARQFDVKSVIVPPHPGLFSAFGLLFADIERHFVFTIPGSRVPLTEAALAHFDDLVAAATTEGALPRTSDGVATMAWFADLRYRGQGHELRIPVQTGGEPVASLADRFAGEHKRVFGHDKPGTPVEVVNLRLIARRRSRWAGTSEAVLRYPRADRSGRQDGLRRPVFFGPKFGLHDTPIFGSRLELGSAAVVGPAVIEEYDTTIVVPPDCRARLDEWGNVRLEFTA